MMDVKLGFSPCPNDTYIMYGLLHGKVTCDDMTFETKIMDVEELNLAAQRAELDLTKLSFKTYYDVSDTYELLDVGAALGRGNGPLLISKDPLLHSDFSSLRIAVPGMNTTATFLLRFAHPEVKNLIPMLFSDIEKSILEGEVDAGVIIHETRFMYAERGFHLIDDLGRVWEQRTEAPIPLGCFVVRKSLEAEIKSKLNDLILESICYADENYQTALPYIRSHAQELEDHIIHQHIDMFVNSYSKHLDVIGRASVKRLFQELNKISNQDRQPTFI